MPQLPALETNAMAGDSKHRVFICGSALSGQPDHSNLSGATLCGPVRTAARYRMHAVANDWHPGIYETETNGVALLGELYELSGEQYAHLESTEPPNMYAADIVLDDDQVVTAFLYPKTLIDDNAWPDISTHGGWAAYKAAS